MLPGELAMVELDAAVLGVLGKDVARDLELQGFEQKCLEWGFKAFGGVRSFRTGSVAAMRKREVQVATATYFNQLWFTEGNEKHQHPRPKEATPGHIPQKRDRNIVLQTYHEKRDENQIHGLPLDPIKEAKVCSEIPIHGVDAIPPHRFV
ncbi:hypothetical protein THAOC_36138 [Thalassiosira oceanica]|uniref:Uncharacterized protein n=1 Tax=Thalassiosira oceanica TaxID=159749 RepID=K0QZW5_THAOC|nr:hypothetical protein THAOC_36138 [Thalassiosira oceanica]|eukprot:EJK45253.1 hypothetical protein THAOC_36138 [Thalassiosira oceanica]